MSEFFDYSPHNGMHYHTEDGDKDGEIVFHRSQDVEPLLNDMADKRKRGDKDGIKQGFWHYCSIPTTVELELRDKGIDIYNKHQTKEVLKEINTNYPYLKATRLKHEL